MRALILGIVMVLAVAGCGPQMHWTKAGFDAAVFQRDSIDCESAVRAGALSFGGGIIGTLNAQNFFNRCLMARGYYLVTNIPAPETYAQALGSPSSEKVDCTKACWTFQLGPDCYTLCEEK